MDETQTERLIGMMQWMLENSVCVDAVCGVENITGADILDAIERLERQGYYELILVLLLKYQEDRAMICAITQYLGDRLGRCLRENGVAGELNVFRTLLSEQLMREKTARG